MDLAQQNPVALRCDVESSDDVRQTCPRDSRVKIDSQQTSSWRVLVALPVGALDYQPVLEWRNQASLVLGRRVLVPWSGGARVGLVVQVLELASERSLALKESIAVLDEQPILTPEACETLLEISRVNLSLDGLALQDFVPFGLEPEFDHIARLVPGVNTDGLPDRSDDLLDWANAKDFDPGLLDFLRSQGLLEEEATLVRPTRSVIAIAPDDFLPEPLPKLTAKQEKAFQALRDTGQFESIAAWARAAKVSSAVATGVIAHGLTVTKLEPLPAPIPNAPEPNPAPEGVNLEFPDAPEIRLHGGKPLDRFAALAPLIHSARGCVLYLAPDRATLDRAFRALGNVRRSGLLHMGLNPRQREELWRRARDGELDAIFGTPMALLVPLEPLALLIVEEEGSDAYKLRSGTRAFVPDAARMRAVRTGAKLVFTGAVPAVESLPMPGIVLPPPRARLHVVDYANQAEPDEMGPMTHIAAPRESWPLSNALKKVLKQVAERGRQAIVIAPRRGYSAVIRCSDCGWLPGCPNCDVPLRYHADRRLLECHQCGHTARPPSRCERCEGTVFAPKGPGSEWIHAELQKLLPNTKVLRYDKDRRDDVSALTRGEPGVIVGTTNVLMLEPPPDLALIALSFADTFATHPDFRASERYHALLRKLLEWHPTRAPLLLIQTFTATHPALLSVLEGHNAEHYPNSELVVREMLRYPPFAKLAQVQVAARRPDDAARAALEAAAVLRDRGAQNDELLGPAPAPIARIKGLYAHNLLLRSNSSERLEQLLETVKRGKGGARIRIDVNPRDIGELLE